jgi:hypothetical protein
MHKTRHATLMKGSNTYSLFKLKSIGNLWQRVENTVNWPEGERGKGRKRQRGRNIQKEKGKSFCTVSL